MSIPLAALLLGAAQALDERMLSNDKLFVVLAVVLIIWAGIVIFLFLTDRKLRRLERSLGERRHPRSDNTDV